MSDKNPIIIALQQVFGPLVQLTTKLPTPLAYGLAIVLAVLMTILLGVAIPRDLLWLLGTVILVTLAAFVFTDWHTRRQSTEDESSVEHILSSSVVYVVVHKMDDQTNVIPEAEVTLALPEPTTKRTNLNGATNFIVPNRYIGKEFAVNARKLGYKARNPLKIVLRRDAYEFIPLEPDPDTRLEAEDFENATPDLLEEQGPIRKRLVYDSQSEEKPFVSWTLYSTVGRFGDRITIVHRPIDGVATFGLKTFSTELVGANKSLRMLYGRVEFEYRVVYSRARGPNIFFYMIPMQETGIGRMGLIEVGTNVQDDPRNAFSPYRRQFFVPLKHFGDGRWHHEGIDFDFRDTPGAFYSIFGPRINEGSVHPGAAHVLMTNLRVFSYE